MRVFVREIRQEVCVRLCFRICMQALCARVGFTRSHPASISSPFCCHFLRFSLLCVFPSLFPLFPLLSRAFACLRVPSRAVRCFRSVPQDLTADVAQRILGETANWKGECQVSE